MRFNESELIIESRKYVFGKIELSPPLSYGDLEIVKNRIGENDLVPFASQLCDKVEHIYFFGTLESIANFCRNSEIVEEALEGKSKVVTCGRIIRDSLDEKFCHIRKI